MLKTYRSRSAFSVPHSAFRIPHQATLGNGSARVEMESFSGSLRLVKRGEIPPPAPRVRERGN